jgi:hypothetical protein
MLSYTNNPDEEYEDDYDDEEDDDEHECTCVMGMNDLLRILPLEEYEIDELIKQGKFPAPTARAWRKTDVDAWWIAKLREDVEE